MPLANILDCIQDKYKVLGIFIIFTLNNGFAWIMFEPVSKWLGDNVKGMSHAQLELLSSWQPIVFLCMFLPLMKLVTSFDGLRVCVRIGTAAELVGAVLKLIGSLTGKSSAGLVFLHMGQIFSGVGSPVAMGCVSALSAIWFEPEERTRATAAAVLFNSVGNSLAYLFVPSLTALISFSAVAGYEVIMAVIATFFAWVVFPQERERSAPIEVKEVTTPATLPSEGPTERKIEGMVVSTTEHASLATQLKALVKMPSCICLLMVYAWLSGGFSAWISLFSMTYSKFYSEQYIGIMCFFGMITYVLGGLVSSYVVDLYFTRQMKYVIFFCVTMNAVSNLIFIACTPNDKNYKLWEFSPGFSKVFIVFSTSLCGFWNGAAAPLFYELVAEISFPVEEGVSGICISVMENVGALVLYQVVSKFFKGQSMSVAYSFGMTISVALIAAVKQRYNRTYHAYLLSNSQE